MRSWTMWLGGAALAVGGILGAARADVDTSSPPPPPKKAKEVKHAAPVVEKKTAPVATTEESVAAYPAKVKSERVNIRAGASENHRILRVAKKGDSLTVIGKVGEWLKIEMPAGTKLWVFGKYVEVSGSKGTVTGEKVQVRAAADGRSDVVGEVNKGAVLKVIGQPGEWVEIESPEGTVAYVSAKYVTAVEGSGETKSTGVARHDIEAKYLRAEDIYKEDVLGRKHLLDVRYDEMMALYREVAAKGDGAIRTKSESRLAELGSWVEKVNRVKTIEKDKEASYKKLQDEYETLLKQTLAGNTKAYLAEGWVEGLGMVIGRPGTHKLMKGGQVYFILKSSKYKLDDFLGKLVGVNGKIDTSHKGWEPVLDVTEIVVLSR